MIIHSPIPDLAEKLEEIKPYDLHNDYIHFLYNLLFLSVTPKGAII